LSRSFEDDVRDLLERAREIADASRHPGPAADARRPLHTVYVPADVVATTTVEAFGAEALQLLETHAPDPPTFAEAFGINPEVAGRTRERVERKLRTDPVEDLRVDFEDGYGGRPDDEEDRHADAAAAALVAAEAGGARSVGIRVKSFADGLEARSVRTLDRCVGALVEAGGVPDGFVVTFPKVIAPGHAALFVEILGRLEHDRKLRDGALRFEIQVETPRSVVDANGAIGAPAIVEAARGRLTAMHFGVFDYTAALGLMPWEQRLDHPANDFARYAVQVAVAGSGVAVSDGSTNVVPASDRTEDVHAAWRVHATHVRHSLRAGFYQGWDLHPSHLVSRYAAVFGWLLPHLDDATERVRALRQGTPEGSVLDEPATVTSLLRFLRFAVSSGAVDEDDVLVRTGLMRSDLFG
jgi:citrate lyase beta subunit